MSEIGSAFVGIAVVCAGLWLLALLSMRVKSLSNVTALLAMRSEDIGVVLTKLGELAESEEGLSAQASSGDRILEMRALMDDTMPIVAEIVRSNASLVGLEGLDAELALGELKDGLSAKTHMGVSALIATILSVSAQNGAAMAFLVENIGMTPNGAAEALSNKSIEINSRITSWPTSGEMN